MKESCPLSKEFPCHLTKLRCLNSKQACTHPKMWSFVQNSNYVRFIALNKIGLLIQKNIKYQLLKMFKKGKLASISKHFLIASSYKGRDRDF